MTISSAAGMNMRNVKALVWAAVVGPGVIFRMFCDAIEPWPVNDGDVILPVLDNDASLLVCGNVSLPEEDA